MNSTQGGLDRYDPPLHGPWQVTSPSDFSNKKAGRRKRLRSAQAWIYFIFLPPELNICLLVMPSQQRSTSHGNKGQRAVPLDDFLFCISYIIQFHILTGSAITTATSSPKSENGKTATAVAKGKALMCS
uniref:Uncharacterized protein n=1 Tax=Rousettus aegyptiacus TaxID=9407 RepID=A0A7J8IMJ9_ROUAE|nr:hypothetical protein HJG63_010723 [Rousettus aegyptiacus]